MIYVFYALAAFVALVLLVVIIAALRPSEFRITRSLLISAGPEMLFPYINNLKKFQEWNPFYAKDTSVKMEYAGPEAGPGAMYHWTGNSNVGEGQMTITDIVPDKLVRVDLEFIKPFPGHNHVEFSLTPQPGGQLVTWDMRGKYALIPKIVGLFISMNKMIGGDFETGLEKLKSIAEQAPA